MRYATIPFFILYFGLTASSLSAQKKGLQEDIYQHIEQGKITLGNDKFSLTIDSKTGQWLGFFDKKLNQNLIVSADLGLDIQIDGVLVFEKTPPQYLGYKIAKENSLKGVILELHFQVAGYDVKSQFIVAPHQAQLLRKASIKRIVSKTDTTTDSRPVKFEGFVFSIPQAIIGKPSDCVFDAPGPFFTHTFIAPESPFDSVKNRNITFHSAPDAGFGLLALSNFKQKRTLAAWMNTGGETNYSPMLTSKGHGAEKGLMWRFHNWRYALLYKNVDIISDVNHIVLTQNLGKALDKYRQDITPKLPLNPVNPQWVNEAVILEVYLKNFKDGLKGLASKLPFYKDIGFNVIYLMPHWVGGYSPIDLYAVDPAFGTAEDLKAVVAKAHSLGMKFIFDMVIHGVNAEVPSPLLKTHPDIFIKTEKGGIDLHRTWKSASTDWASPAYQAYMRDLVLHDLKTYDIDGYRVDAASYKGANWDTSVPYPAYKSGAAAPELMRVMLDALRQYKPQAMFLNEVFGPAFYTVSNWSHDNQTEAPTFILEALKQGTYTAAHYQKHISNVYRLLPKGAKRVFFARNHDTSWFFRFNGYTPDFMAFDAIHALFGIPEVFVGDPDNPHSPDEKPEIFENYKKLFALRRAFPELITGEIDLNSVRCTDKNVFVGLRLADKNQTLVAVSMGDKPIEASITLPPTFKARVWSVVNYQTGKTKEIVLQKGALQVSLAPYEVLVGRLIF